MLDIYEGKMDASKNNIVVHFLELLAIHQRVFIVRYNESFMMRVFLL